MLALIFDDVGDEVQVTNKGDEKVTNKGDGFQSFKAKGKSDFRTTASHPYLVTRISSPTSRHP